MLSENKFTKYLIYALGEIVLVVIGILIALQINNWNENRKLVNQELALLTEVKSALENDLNDVNSNLEREKGRFNSMNLIIDWIESELPYHDSLSMHFSNISYGTFFNDNESAYLALKQIGLQIVSNDSLRNKLSELYDLEYELYDKHDKEGSEAKDAMNALSAKYLNEIAFFGTKMRPVDIAGLRADNEYKFYLKSLRNFIEVRVNMFIPTTIDKISTTIKMLEDELETRK